MRILIATPLYPPDLGGPSTYAKLLEEGFKEQGVGVIVVKWGEVRKYPKVLRHIMYFFKVFKEIHTVDLVLALDPVSAGFPAFWASFFAGRKFVVKVVGDYAWEQGTQRYGITAPLDVFVQQKNVPLAVSFFRLIQTFVARNAAAVIVPSVYLKSIVSSWGITESRIQVIYNAFKSEEVGVVPESVMALPNPMVVTVARLVPWKGVKELIDAISVARKELPTLSLVVVGEGPDRTALESYAKSVLTDKYLFTGPLTHRETLGVMNEGDIFALNTSYEGFSHVLIEALSLGKVVVTTPVGGNVELITNGENGIFVPVHNIEQLARAFVSICTNKSLKDKIEKKAKESVTIFSREALLTNTREFLQRLV